MKISLLLILVLLCQFCSAQPKLRPASGDENNRVSDIACNSWLNLPSQGSFVDIGQLNITGTQLTVEATANRSSFSSNNTVTDGDLVSKHSGPNDANYILRPTGALITTSDGFFATPPVCAIVLNKTYHYAMTYDGVTLKFFRNGFLMSSVAAHGNLFQNNWHTKIGLYDLGTLNENFIGYMNEVRIWNVVRSQSQIQAYMYNPLPSPSTQTGLQAYYTFDNLFNKQGNALWNGKLGGAATVNKTNPTCGFIADSCEIRTATTVVIPTFTAPDTVCVNTPVNITNTTLGASTYFWNFCVSGINSIPSSQNLGNPGGILSSPVFSDIVEDNGKFYAFVVNHLPGGLVRLDFGNSMLNTPTPVYLGNPSGAMNATNGGNEGIQMIKNEGKWYAIIVGGNPIYGATWPRLVKIEFGANIANNTPTGTNWGNLGTLNEPIDLHMFQDNNGVWYGFSVNAVTNTITKFNFTNSFSNTPTAVNLGNIGNLNYPTGIYAVNDNGSYKVFVCNGGSSTITRLDFGNSMLNTPTGTNLGNPGGVLNQPRDMTILRLCDEIAGFAVNGTSADLVKLDFHNNLSSVPSGSSLGNTGNLNFPHSISKLFRVGNDLYTLITNVTNNTITRLRFAGCTSSSTPSSALQNPLPVTYNTPGVYNINLSVDEGLATQNSFCRQIVVVPELVHTPMKQVISCNSATRKIGTGVKQVAYLWNTGAVTDSIDVTTPGIYWVRTSRFGCSNTDSFTVVNEVVSVQTNSDTAICAGKSIQLNVTGTAANYSWSPATDLSNPFIANPVATPLATTKYVVTATGAAGCIATDTVLITISAPSACTVTAITPSFTSADTICVNTPLKITNTTAGGSSYYWNFCVAGINSTPSAQNLGNPGGKLSQPVFSDIAEDNGKYYAFVVDFLNSGLTRLDFGNSMLNTPVATDLGNPSGALNAIYGKEGIQVIKNEGKWYAIIVGGNTPGNGSIPKIVKIEFGTNIANNTPTGTDWGNLGNLFEPIDLHMFNQNGVWFGFTVNANSNTITRFNFTSSFNNKPTAVNLGNIGNLNYPTGIYSINDNGNYRVFICNGGSSTLTRLDFGNSLLNTPTGINLGNPSGIFGQPRDMTILRLCGEIAGFAVNANNNTLVKLDFHNDLSTVPTGSSLGNTGNLNFPHSLSKFFRVDNDLYTLITNVTNNTITRLRFAGCTTASAASSALQNPPDITYSIPGTYHINLSVDDGLATQGAYCKQVVVVPALVHTPLQNIISCKNLSVKIGTGTKQVSYLWSTGATTDSIDVTNPGIYWVQTSSRFGCSNVDSFTVAAENISVKAGNDTILCAGKSVQLNASGAVTSYSWSPATNLSNPAVSNPLATPGTTTQYVVSGITANGCVVTDTVKVSIDAVSVTISTNDTTLCAGKSVQLKASGTAVGYSWSPATNLSDPSVLNPLATPAVSTKYVVAGTTANGCVATDTVMVNIDAVAVTIKTNDTIVCASKPVQLNATGTAISYSWSPALGLSDAGISNPVATPLAATQYIVSGTSANGCVAKDTVMVNVDAPSVAIKTNDTTLCAGKSVQLNASGTVASYSWSPATNLSNSSVSNPLATPATTTKYVVTGTSTNGCVVTDTVIVNIDAPSVAIKTNDTTLCAGKSVQLNASGTVANYSWLPATNLSNPSVSNPLATPTTSTQYIVSGTTVNGCIAKDTVMVNIDAVSVTIKTNDTTVCASKPVQLNVTGTTVSYSWSPATNLSDATISNPLATPGTSTQYIVSGTNANGCVAKDTIMVTIDAVSVAININDTILCAGKSIRLNASGTAVNYSWSPAASLSNPSVSNPMATPVTTTQYIVAGTNARGCVAKDSVMVNIDAVSVTINTNDTTVCAGRLVQLNSSSTAVSSYSWSPVTGVSNATTANPVVGPASTTQYIVTATDANGCLGQDTVLISVNPVPVITKTADTTVCRNKPLQLNVNGGNTYAWAPSPTLSNLNIQNPVASPVANTVYYVTVTNTGNCSSSDSVRVSLKPVPVFAISGGSETCVGTSVRLAAAGGNTYSWQPAGELNNGLIANPVATPTHTTLYTVKIIENTCQDSVSLSTLLTVLPLPVVQARSSNDVSCSTPAAQLTASGAMRYLWQPSAGLNDSAISTPLASPSASTMFIVKGIDAKGCSNYDSVAVLVTHTGDLLMNMPNAFTPNGDGRNDCFGVSRYIGFLQQMQLSIYNRWGERVFYTTDPSQCWDGRYKGKLQDAGGFVYILQANTFCGVVFKKGIVMLLK